MDIFTELKLRGVINNITNEQKLKSFLKTKGGIYVGFDPSFSSLHLGNYMMIATLRRLKSAGFETYALLGGATGLIGDPSGKKQERNLQEVQTIENNLKEIKKQLEKYSNSKTFNNYEIYKEMTIFTFLRLVGKLINVNYLLEKEIISSRLESGLSYAEFSYNLIQGYDFLYLYKNKNIKIQMGGSDQWGNITTGIEMIRKSFGDNNDALGITVNLLTKSDGTKFGKSEKGAIYLNPEITSPYEMYQFLINQPDADVEKLLKALTFLSFDEINSLMKEHNTAKGKFLAQKKLAQCIVSDIHGVDEFKKCEARSQVLFGADITSLPPKDLYESLKSTPTFIAKNPEIGLSEIMIGLKIVPSKSAARTLIDSKAIIVNGRLINSYNEVIKKSDAILNKFSYIKKGKKNFYLIDWQC